MKLRRYSSRLVIASAIATCLLGAVTGCSSTKQPDPIEQPEPVPDIQALHVTMRDGTNIAVDVWLPPGRALTDSFPTLVRGTRYWRAFEELKPLPEGGGLPEVEEAARAHARGYALVLVDARGSGASSGSRAYPWSSDEKLDYGEVIDWIAKRPWSNGKVVSYGVSYDGNVADFIALVDHPAIVACSPQFSDVNPFTDLIAPGGVRNDTFVQGWSDGNKKLDSNDFCGAFGFQGAECAQLSEYVGGVKPVDGDTDGTLLSAALKAHKDNVDVAALFSTVEYSDSAFNGTEAGDIGPEADLPTLQQLGTPLFAMASWMDAGTADGALRRYLSSSSPQTLYIGAWEHGGGETADPFRATNAPLEIDRDEQLAAMFDYFDAAIAGTTPAREIHYYTMGENKWRTTDSWPPADVSPQSFYLGSSASLSSDAPTDISSELYNVDFSHNTGAANRWMQDDIEYADRAGAPVLAYATEPLSAPLRVTGSAVVSVQLESSHADAAVYVYLEDVAPDGRVTYVTEGILRLIHRAEQADPAFKPVTPPARSFTQADAAPMPIDQREEIRIVLAPTSVLFKAGHRVRVSIAGHDASVFQRIPEEGTPSFRVHHGGNGASHIVLPVAAP